ncbi:hypothetical protein ACFQHO_05455 [Actinomadura yumaensis]|uniref:hypothetical protein n=1 Tax=Actinomadura yumaensis TaxID=111807 RepID=UPI003620E6E6
MTGGWRGALRGRLRLSVRARLTLVYGSLSLVIAAALVAFTYVVTARAMEQRFTGRAPPRRWTSPS